jgi:hypothetical protein
VISLRAFATIAPRGTKAIWPSGKRTVRSGAAAVAADGSDSSEPKSFLPSRAKTV